MSITFHVVGRKAKDPLKTRGYIVHADGLHEAINAPGFEGPLDYDGAVAALVALNEQAWGGFTDWRLPDVMEAQRPVDRTRYDPACDTAVYPDAVGSGYWTSVETPWSREQNRKGSARSFFVVGMGGGNVYYGSADLRFRARPVRVGGPAPASQ